MYELGMSRNKYSIFCHARYPIMHNCFFTALCEVFLPNHTQVSETYVHNEFDDMLVSIGSGLWMGIFWNCRHCYVF